MEVKEDVLAYVTEAAPPVVDVTCETTAADKEFGTLSGMKVFVCPAGCSKFDHKVYNQHDLYWY